MCIEDRLQAQIRYGSTVFIAPNCRMAPTVTKAMELIRSGIVLSDPTCLRRVIDLSVDLSDYSGEIRDAINRFLEIAEKMGAKTSYIATHRKAWWSVGLRDPAPILATYMARRPPTFVLNEADARHINIAHGLYPRARLKKRTLTSLVRYLRGSATLHGGRVYSGGLTKFEPREMERIPVPGPKLLDENRRATKAHRRPGRTEQRTHYNPGDR